MPPRKIHVLPWSSSLGIYPPLKAEIGTAFNPSTWHCRREQWTLSICIYEEMKMGKIWAFGFCPLLSFTLNVCPGFAVPLQSELAWADRALFSVLTQRGITGRPWCGVYHINPHRAAMAIGWTQHSLLNALGNSLVLSGRLNKLSQTKLLRAQYNYIFSLQRWQQETKLYSGLHINSNIHFSAKNKVNFIAYPHLGLRNMFRVLCKMINVFSWQRGKWELEMLRLSL